MICSSRTIRLLNSLFASTCITYGTIVSSYGQQNKEGKENLPRRLTFLAMTVPVTKCLTLLTVPPLPDPNSLMTSISSGRRSSLYSMPISKCPSLSSFLSSVGGGFGAAGVKARPLTFLRFIERGAKGSAILSDRFVEYRQRRYSTRVGVYITQPGPRLTMAVERLEGTRCQKKGTTRTTLKAARICFARSAGVGTNPARKSKKLR